MSRVRPLLIILALGMSAAPADSVKKKPAIKPIQMSIQYPESYELEEGEGDSLLQVLFSSYGVLSHSSQSSQIVLTFEEPEVRPVSKMAADLVRLELSGHLVLKIGDEVKKSIPFQGRSIEEGKLQAFRVALGSVRWDEELIEIFFRAFKHSGGVVGTEKEAL